MLNYIIIEKYIVNKMLTMNDVNWTYKTRNKQQFIERKLKEHMMAFRIQCRWRKANYDPEYKLCKNRLMKECEILGFE